MPSPDCRGQLEEAGGIDLLADLAGGCAAGSSTSSGGGLLAAVARLAEAAANKDEDNKCRWGASADGLQVWKGGGWEVCLFVSVLACCGLAALCICCRWHDCIPGLLWWRLRA